MPDSLPMHDVVELVLLAEGESKHILDDAQAEAERIVTEARRKAQDSIQTTRRETAEQSDAIVKTAEQDAEHEKEERLAQAATDIETAGQLNEQAVRTAIEATLRCVCGEQ